MSNNAGGKQIMENQFPSKSLSGRGENRVDATAKINKFEHDRITSAGRRDEYQADAISDRNNFYSKQLNEQAEHLYGKIQSRTFSSSVNGSETPSSIGSGNYDRCNANIQLNGGTKRCDNSNGIVMNCVNNNNFDGGQLHHFHQHNGINNNMSDNLLNDGYVCQNKMNLVPPIGSAVHGNIRRSSGETNRNMLRTNRYNGSHLSAPGTHQLAHMMHTLSSPESAYSTGYSTDGTSPADKFHHLRLAKAILQIAIRHYKTITNGHPIYLYQPLRAHIVEAF
ncbi:hypothetical protein Bhyg_08958 [Pseudolycoriella hygida]|uniref:Uncharacterized protein n=1 Tax=Pseudolycoriella hygida TaxID=35572 RepID=A0A9Q0S4T8_9DIPT|nr:hypothetical protein Bhyg_08958 [Pseudolycoriella hygida]